MVGALAALLLLGPDDTGHGWALVALLAVGAALVAGHLVDLVFPRPQLADDVPRGLLGLRARVAGRRRPSPSSAATSWGTCSARWPRSSSARCSAAVAALSRWPRATWSSRRTPTGPPDGERPAGRSWALPLIQVVLPLAACAPVALALQTVL